MELPQDITFEQIRQRAYELWERNHRPDGFEIEFWLMAEKELKVERKRSLLPEGSDETKTLPAGPKVQGQGTSRA